MEFFLLASTRLALALIVLFVVPNAALTLILKGPGLWSFWGSGFYRADYVTLMILLVALLILGEKLLVVTFFNFSLADGLSSFC